MLGVSQGKPSVQADSWARKPGSQREGDGPPQAGSCDCRATGPGPAIPSRVMAWYLGDVRIENSDADMQGQGRSNVGTSGRRRDWEGSAEGPLGLQTEVRSH